MNSYKLKIVGALSFLCAFFSAAAVHAADYQLLEPLPFIQGGTVTSFYQYVTGAYTYGIVGAGVCAVVMIIWGGFDYVLTEKVTGKAEGKKKINNAVIGLLIALGSFAILYTINPALTQIGTNGCILPPIDKTDKC